MLLDVSLLAESTEVLGAELCPVVNYYLFRYPESTDDMLPHKDDHFSVANVG